MGIWHYIIYNFLVVFVITIDIQAALELEKRAFPPKPTLRMQGKPKKTKSVTIAESSAVIEETKRTTPGVPEDDLEIITQITEVPTKESEALNPLQDLNVPQLLELRAQVLQKIKESPQAHNPLLAFTGRFKYLKKIDAILQEQDATIILEKVPDSLYDAVRQQNEKKLSELDDEEKEYRTTKVDKGFHERQAVRLWGNTINPAPMPIEDILESLNSSLTIITDLQEKIVAAKEEFLLNPLNKKIEKHIKYLEGNINFEYLFLADLISAIPAWNNLDGFINLENFDATIATLQNIAEKTTNQYTYNLVTQKISTLKKDRDSFINFIRTQPHRAVFQKQPPGLPKIGLTSVGGMYLKKR